MFPHRELTDRLQDRATIWHHMQMTCLLTFFFLLLSVTPHFIQWNSSFNLTGILWCCRYISMSYVYRWNEPHTLLCRSEGLSRLPVLYPKYFLRKVLTVCPMEHPSFSLKISVWYLVTLGNAYCELLGWTLIANEFLVYCVTKAYIGDVHNQSSYIQTGVEIEDIQINAVVSKSWHFWRQ